MKCTSIDEMDELYYDEYYPLWENLVNDELYKLCGMGIDFLPDWNSRDAFNDGMTPKQAAKQWLAYAKECF